MDTDKDLDKELEQDTQTSSDKALSDDGADMAIENDIAVENNETSVDETDDIEEKKENSEAENIEAPIEAVETAAIDNEKDLDSEYEADGAQGMITVRPVKFQKFEMTEPNRSIKKNLDIMQDVPMHVSVELGRAKSTIKEVMDMNQGSIVELDKIAGEQVEVYVNNKIVAKGEVIVIEDKFGVRVTSTNIPKTIQ